MSDERREPQQWDRRATDREWRIRVERDIETALKQLDELLRIKQQVAGGLKVVVGFIGIVTGTAAFAYVVIQLLKAAIHGL